LLEADRLLAAGRIGEPARPDDRVRPAAVTQRLLTVAPHDDELPDGLERLGAGDVDLGHQHDVCRGRRGGDDVPDALNVDRIRSVRPRQLRRLDDDDNSRGIGDDRADVVRLGDAAGNCLDAGATAVPAQHAHRVRGVAL